jgi:[ribosomal protein S18]-alanine N-acetyltransferase
MEWEKVIIQKMDMQDLDEVVSLESSYSGAPWSKGMFVEEIRNPFACCFVMKREDRSRPRVIGFICFRNVAEESELLNICVHSDHRQLGAGKRLMEFYVDFSRRSGITTFHLEVHSSNHSAIRLYRKFSYEASGMRKKFYQGRFDAVLMTKRV